MKKVLYHGSSKEIKGELHPKQPRDLEDNPENLVCGIYATDIRNMAIAMAIISCKGVHASSIKFEKISKGVVYKGWPEQENVFLYILPKEDFKKSKGVKHQFVSGERVKPLKVEKLKVKDYLHLIRKATDKEKKSWIKKYGKL